MRYDRCDSSPRSLPSSSRCEAEQQVQAERAAQAADRDHQVDQLGSLGEQLGELVDHDDQRGERRQLGTGHGGRRRSR